MKVRKKEPSFDYETSLITFSVGLLFYESLELGFDVSFVFKNTPKKLRSRCRM